MFVSTRRDELQSHGQELSVINTCICVINLVVQNTLHLIKIKENVTYLLYQNLNLLPLLALHIFQLQ